MKVTKADNSSMYIRKLGLQIYLNLKSFSKKFKKIGITFLKD